MKFKPQYSGKNSKKFWKEINSFSDSGHFTNHEFLYTLGCILQETEGRVVRELNDQIKLRKKSL